MNLICILCWIGIHPFFTLEDHTPMFAKTLLPSSMMVEVCNGCGKRFYGRSL